MKILPSVANNFSYVSRRYSLYLKKTVNRWTLMFPGSGCEYWKKTGGCTMCGFNNATQSFTKGRLLPSFVFEFIYHISKLNLTAEPDEVAIYNGGSFWNDNEIPSKFQRFLLNKIGNGNARRILIENRCEYITEEKIRDAVILLGGKKLMVGIGLESSDDYIRNKLIGKGLSKKSFEEKVAILREYNANILAYIFLKPLELSEEQAYADVIASIQYALSVGVSEIEISCAFVQENTPMFLAYSSGRFLPPSLWTILKIVEQVRKNNWPVSIGGFSDEPPPIAIPSNCNDCSDLIYKAIERFRQERILSDIPECECKNSFKNYLIPLPG